MPTEKELAKDAVHILAEKAEDCFDGAQAQHEIADLQQASAEKLVILAEELQDGAVKLNGELEMTAARCSAPIEEAPRDVAKRASKLAKV
jgi:hypothetical protein